VALTVAVMEALSLGEFQVNLGQMAFFRAVTGDLPAPALAAIREAVDHKSGPRIAAALARAGVEGQQRELLQRLPDLIGGPEILDQARTLSAGLAAEGAALAALERLAEAYRLLGSYGVAGRVILDLGEVRGMEYYTGITFRGVAPGLGWPVVSGGRYDDLIAHFGRPLAAVGFGLGIERVLLVQARQGLPRPPLAPDLLVHGCDRAPCLALVGRLRRLGCRVAVDLLGLAPAELAQEARQRGITRTLRCEGGAWLLGEGSGERAVVEATLLQEAGAWVSQRAEAASACG